jgi:hypothetical protein
LRQLDADQNDKSRRQSRDHQNNARTNPARSVSSA